MKVSNRTHSIVNQAERLHYYTHWYLSEYPIVVIIVCHHLFDFLISDFENGILLGVFAKTVELSHGILHAGLRSFDLSFQNVQIIRIDLVRYRRRDTIFLLSKRYFCKQVLSLSLCRKIINEMTYGTKYGQKAQGHDGSHFRSRRCSSTCNDISTNRQSGIIASFYTISRRLIIECVHSPDLSRTDAGNPVTCEIDDTYQHVRKVVVWIPAKIDTRKFQNKIERDKVYRVLQQWVWAKLIFRFHTLCDAICDLFIVIAHEINRVCRDLYRKR